MVDQTPAAGTAPEPNSSKQANVWLLAAVTGLAYMIVATLALPLDDVPISYRIGVFTGQVVIGVVVGALLASRLKGLSRGIAAVVFPLVITVGVLIVSHGPEIADETRERESLGEPAQSRVVFPNEMNGWTKLTTPEAEKGKRAMMDRLAQEPDAADMRPAAELYGKDDQQLVLVGFNAVEGSGFQRYLADSPAQAVEGALDGADATSQRNFDSGIDGVALRCGVMPQSAVNCVWADSTSEGSLLVPGDGMRAALKLTKELLPVVREPLN